MSLKIKKIFKSSIRSDKFKVYLPLLPASEELTITMHIKGNIFNMISV